MFKKSTHGASLGFGAGVPRETFVAETAFVAHPDAVAVVVLTVRPDHLKGTACLDGSVTTNHIVIAATVFPTAGTMPAVDVLNATLLIRTHCRAVKDDEVDGSHF